MRAGALSFPNHVKFAVETLISSALALAEYEARAEEARRQGRDERRLHLLDDGAMVAFDLDGSSEDELRAELEIDEVSSSEEEDAIADALLRLAGEPLPPTRLHHAEPPHPAHRRRDASASRHPGQANERSLAYLVRVFRAEDEDDEALRAILDSSGDA